MAHPLLLVTLQERALELTSSERQSPRNTNESQVCNVLSLYPLVQANLYWRIIMLQWTLTFLILAIIAGVLGFGGIAAGAAGIAKILFFIFLIGLIVSLIMNVARGRTPM